MEALIPILVQYVLPVVIPMITELLKKAFEKTVEKPLPANAVPATAVAVGGLIGTYAEGHVPGASTLWGLLMGLAGTGLHQLLYAYRYKKVEKPKPEVINAVSWLPMLFIVSLFSSLLACAVVFASTAKAEEPVTVDGMKFLREVDPLLVKLCSRLSCLTYGVTGLLSFEEKDGTRAYSMTAVFAVRGSKDTRRTLAADILFIHGKDGKLTLRSLGQPYRVDASSLTEVSGND